MHPPSLRARALRTGLLALALTAFVAPTADAQDLIRSWTGDVKLEDGTTARWTTTLTYDAASGEYLRTITDASGATIKQETTRQAIYGPSDEEVEQAKALILADDELGALYQRASNPVLSGGFTLLREEGHACGPGSRCLMFDLYDVDGRNAERIRFVVVDLGTRALVSRDFDPDRDSNATRFNSDRR